MVLMINTKLALSSQVFTVLRRWGEWFASLQHVDHLSDHCHNLCEWTLLVTSEGGNLDRESGLIVQHVPERCHTGYVQFPEIAYCVYATLLWKGSKSKCNKKLLVWSSRFTQTLRGRLARDSNTPSLSWTNCSSRQALSVPQTEADNGVAEKLPCVPGAHGLRKWAQCDVCSPGLPWNKLRVCLHCNHWVRLQFV